MKKKTRAGMPGLARPRTLGPLTELERHLPPEWWKTLFNAVYLKTDSDVVEDQRITQEEIDTLVRTTGISRGDRILDLCCGQGRHALELARRGYGKVTGLDRSRYLIRLARQRAAKSQLDVRFHEGDARKLRFAESSFDVITIMGNSFGYFDSEQGDVEILRSVRRCLRAGGLLILDLANGAWLREHYEKRSWEWIDDDQFVCRERDLSSDGARLISREVVVDAEKGIMADQFYAERLYDEPTILQLLLDNGFENPVVLGTPETSSARNQDLGMMAHRIWISAHNTAKAPKKPKSAPPPREICVLLGDPLLPDLIKRDGRFNEEDVMTVEKLKTALAGLDGHQFTYLDNHATLLDQLRGDPPAFVFNLCDEGYMNDPLKELHVPALLEMLKIPYSGGSPACLGLCYNKSLVNAIAQSLDIPVPAETLVAEPEFGGTIPTIYPALLKPVRGDSSFGIDRNAVVHSPEEALEQINHMRWELGITEILIQEFLQGTEVSVALIGNPDDQFFYLPILEVDYSELAPELPAILSYESKWEPDSPYWNQIRYREFTGSEESRRLLYEYSVRLFERLECRDYARFDFRFDLAGVPRLLEVNPNPGWCWDGKMNIMNELAGYSYPDFLAAILSAAHKRVEGHALSHASIPA